MKPFKGSCLNRSFCCEKLQFYFVNKIQLLFHLRSSGWNELHSVEFESRSYNQGKKCFFLNLVCSILFKDNVWDLSLHISGIQNDQGHQRSYDLFV